MRIVRLFKPRYGGSPDMTRCRAEVGSGHYRSQCTRKVKLERDGVGYCAQHDPVVVQAKMDAWNRNLHAKMDAQQRARDQAHASAAFKCEAVEALRKIADGYNDARGLAQEVMSKQPESPE